MNHYYNEVNSWLLVGADIDIAASMGYDYKSTIDHLKNDMGVTHVLDVRSEWNDRDTWVSHGLPLENYCHLPIIDSWSHDPARSWYLGVEDFISRFLDESKPGERVYVHCHMGINRGPSAAMLALLTADPNMDPWDAFMAIREARSIAGLVYADKVAAWHLQKAADNPAEPAEGLLSFLDKFDAYWTPDLRTSVHRGISFYRQAEGGTLTVGK